VAKIDNLLEGIERDKMILEKALCDAWSSFPNINELKSFIQKYKSIYKEVIEIEDHVTQAGWTPFFEDNLGDIISKVDNIGQGIKKNTKGKEGPSFDLGISSPDSVGNSQKDPDKNEQPHEKKTEGAQKGDQKPVEIDQDMNEDEELVWSYLLLIEKDKNAAETKGVEPPTEAGTSEIKEKAEVEKLYM